MIERKPWEHQVKALSLALAPDMTCFGLFMEQGTGKTFTAIQVMRELFKRHRRYLKTLIICPQIVVKNWASEIAQFSLCGDVVQQVVGDKKKRIAAMRAPGKHIFVTNTEMLSVGEGVLWERYRRGKSELRRPIDHGWELIIIDESHRIKSGSAASSKMAHKLAKKAFFRYILTGTPILNGEVDIWSQFRFLDNGATFGTSFQAFRAEFFYDENAGMPKQTYFPAWKVRPEKLPEMNAKIYAKAFRVLKDECMDLPPLVTKTIHVELSPQQKKHYAEMKRDFITYLDGTACVAEMAMIKALRLQQITTGFVKLEDGRVIPLDAGPRLNALSEILSDLGPRKVIIWAVWKENYEAIAKVCAALGRSYTFLTGLQTQAEKDAAERDFTKGDVQTLICNPAAGGTGVNLIEADTAIWYSRNFRLGDRLQAIARNHRGGSEMHTKVTMIDIVAEATIDVSGLEALERKEDIAERILSWRDKI